MTSSAAGHRTGVSGTRDTREALPGAEERTVTTDDGATLAVTVAPGTAGATVAAGPTVVFAHGWTNNRSVWGPVARRVAAEGHPVVLYDQRGHGASTLGTDPLGMERLGDDLAQLLEQLDLRGVVLVGHSMGGFTIMSFACRHRDQLHGRVRGMALVSTAAHGLSMGRMAPLAERLLRSRTMERMVRARSGLVLTRRVLGRRPRLEDVVSTRAMFLATPAEVRAGYFATFGAMDLRTGLADVEVPTVVVVGTRDTLTPPRLGQVVAETIPGARYEVLPHAGHMLPLERTGEVVAEVMTLAR